MTYIITPFAENNTDKVNPSFTINGDGSISYSEGYGPLYSIDPATTGLRIERNEFNGLMHTVTTEIQQYQQNGVPAFITSAQNGGSPFSYGAGAIVTIAGVTYISTSASNTNTPPHATWIDILSFLNSLTGENGVSVAVGGTPQSRVISGPQMPTRISFTTTGAGVWNRPAGCRYIRFQLWGGGAAGGAAKSFGSSIQSCGGGGGGGGYAEGVIDVTSIPSIPFIIGTGGINIAAGAGNDGGDSGLGGVQGVTCFGGSGGFLGTTDSVGSDGLKSGRGGGVTVGTDYPNTIIYNGGDGGPPCNVAGVLTGKGGVSFGGSPREASFDFQAPVAHTRGCGGPGGASLGGNLPQGGGGFRGELIIEEFY